MTLPLQTIGVNLVLFADDTCLYVTQCKEGNVLRKLWHRLSSMVVWCKCWNIEVNEEKNREIYFSHRIRLPESLLTLNGRNIQFANFIKYLGVIFDTKFTWRLNRKL
jgi:hypothetical protein